MKYTNANQVLPEELLEQIQDYIQGGYLYIPIREKNAMPTDYQTELIKRDEHIYTKYLEGVSNRKLSQIYNLSESSIRRIIIKQRGRYRTMNEQINTILAYWELAGTNVKQIYDTTWQVGEDYILKVYDGLDMLERNKKILCILDRMSIPVGRIIPACENKLYVESGSNYYILTGKLPGSNIVDLNNPSNLAELMGETIADLHLAFRECEKEEVFWNNSLLEEMNGWVKDAFIANNWKYVSEELYESVVASLAQNYDKLPVQLIHRDVHFGNFLFDHGKFSGYIDFDISQRNIRIFDLCYFLLGLLSEEEKFEITKEQWFGFVTNVFVGYEKKLKISEAEKIAVPYVMECIELLFAAYFAGIDDTVCAEDAMKIFKFVKEQEERIRKCIP